MADTHGKQMEISRLINIHKVDSIGREIGHGDPSFRRSIILRHTRKPRTVGVFARIVNAAKCIDSK